MVKQLKRITIGGVLLIALSACSIIRTMRLNKLGDVPKRDFVEEISFKNRSGLAIVPIEINGESYNFILDTAAPNVISEELFEKLELRTIFKQKVTDSNGATDKLKFVKVPQMRIGSTDFENFGAIVADLRSNKLFSCLDDIHGILGTNLLSRLALQIDFTNEKIRFSNRVDLLNTSDFNVEPVHMMVSKTKTPFLPVFFNGKVQYLKVDFGSNGGVVGYDRLINTLNSSNSDNSQISIGANSVGLYNTIKNDTTQYVRMSSVTIGNDKFKNTVVEFTSGDSATIGTEFLSNYVTTIDWINEKIYLKKTSNYVKDQLRHFGISWYPQGNKLYVQELFVDSEAYQLGIRLNQEIVEINGVSTVNLDTKTYCHLYNTSYGDTLTLKIFTDESVKTYHLTKQQLL